VTENDNAKLTATMKTGPGYGDAWLVVRADSPVELHSTLTALSDNGVGAVLGSANASLTASYNIGKGLDATPVAAPTNPQPQAQQPAQDNPWAQQPQQQTAPPADANPWGASTPASQPQQQAAANPNAAGNFPGAETPPMVLGMPARKVTGSNAKGPWAAWADPRPREATQHLGRDANTDDPNDPGLAQGTKKFWAWIR
jgi:hypothetical protein